MCGAIFGEHLTREISQMSDNSIDSDLHYFFLNKNIEDRFVYIVIIKKMYFNI